MSCQSRRRDSTLIGYDEQGLGRTVILIDGALGYRRFGAASTLAKLLAPRFRVITYDRRGRAATPNPTSSAAKSKT